MREQTKNTKKKREVSVSQTPKKQSSNPLSKAERAAAAKAVATGYAGLDLLSMVICLVAEKSQTVHVKDMGKGEMGILVNMPLAGEDGEIDRLPMIFKIQEDIPLDLQGAADHVGRDVRTVQRWISAGELPVCRELGTRPIIWLRDLEACVENKRSINTRKG